MIFHVAVNAHAVLVCLDVFVHYWTYQFRLPSGLIRDRIHTFQLIFSESLIGLRILVQKVGQYLNVTRNLFPLTPLSRQVVDDEGNDLVTATLLDGPVGLPNVDSSPT